MTTTKFQDALQAYFNINDAMTRWDNGFPGDQWERGADPVRNAGWDALANVHAKAIDAVGETEAISLQDISMKATFIATLPDYADVIDPWAMKSIKALSADLSRFMDRPQDRFTILINRYDQAVADVEDAKVGKPDTMNGRNAATDAYEAKLEPLHDAVHETAQAVLRAHAPDAAAIAEKLRVFNEQSMAGAGDDDNHAFFNQLAADAIALAK